MPHSRTILSLGKFVFDLTNGVDHMPVPGEKNTAKTQVIMAGGGAVNAAICIAALGMQSHLHATMPTDYFRDAAERMLIDRDVRVIGRDVQTSSFNSVFTGVGDRAVVRAPKRAYASEDFPKLEPDDYDVLVLDGYQEDAALHHAQKFSAASKLVLLDCNPRPNTDDLLSFTQAAVAGESYLKGKFDNPIAALDYFKTKGCRVRAVTLGECGLWWCADDGEPAHIEALPVWDWASKNSNGLGDAFHGALAYSYARWREEGWHHHFSFANCYAGLMLEKSDGERFYPAVENVLARMQSHPIVVRASA